MTIEEADKRVREAKERVLKAAGAWHRETLCGHRGLYDAVLALEAAEAGRAALDKPRLVTPEERVGVGNPADSYNAGFSVWSVAQAARIVKADRADILTQAEKLPRVRITTPDVNVSAVSMFTVSATTELEAVYLSDLRNLIEGK